MIQSLYPGGREDGGGLWPTAIPFLSPMFQAGAKVTESRKPNAFVQIIV